MPPDKIRVLLVEDHALVREGTKMLIERDASIEVVGEAEDRDQALELVDRLCPDVVLLDIRLRSGSGIEVARALQRMRHPTRVLVLSAYDFDQYVAALVRAGVRGYVLKDLPAEDLIRAIHDVHEGKGVLPGSIAATVIDDLSRDTRQAGRPPDDLTIREIEVIELLAQAYSNQRIADRLGISVRTVEAHVTSILGKLGASSRAEAVHIATAVRIATKGGIIHPER
jgi:DNA-binding NarL/FixJ family response regulator